MTTETTATTVVPTTDKALFPETLFGFTLSMPLLGRPKVSEDLKRMFLYAHLRISHIFLAVSLLPQITFPLQECVLSSPMWGVVAAADISALSPQVVAEVELMFGVFMKWFMKLHRLSSTVCAETKPATNWILKKLQLNKNWEFDADGWNEISNHLTALEHTVQTALAKQKNCKLQSLCCQFWDLMAADLLPIVKRLQQLLALTHTAVQSADALKDILSHLDDRIERTLLNKASQRLGEHFKAEAKKARSQAQLAIYKHIYIMINMIYICLYRLLV
eukprot:Lankesteria_metandrocarpae@DN5179_c0_g1_i1.p1